ncbi:hypothetical protein M758_N002600 [Ceratodon purpureus]|nr:hypothetical protein M758_N002600 [Ceratodon purpureus]
MIPIPYIDILSNNFLIYQPVFGVRLAFVSEVLVELCRHGCPPLMVLKLLNNKGTGTTAACNPEIGTPVADMKAFVNNLYICLQSLSNPGRRLQSTERNL